MDGEKGLPVPGALQNRINKCVPKSAMCGFRACPSIELGGGVTSAPPPLPAARCPEGARARRAATVGASISRASSLPKDRGKFSRL